MILIEVVTKRGIIMAYDCEQNLCAKSCVKCLELKPIIEFHKYSRKSSRRKDCIPCFNLNWKVLREKYKKEHKQLLNKWRSSNPDKVKLQNKRRKRTDKHRETSRVYWSKNKEKKRAIDGNRRVQKGKSVYCKLRSQDTECIYKKCIELNKLSNEKLVVDHIIPLVHPDVCGLHCPENLQIIPLKQNSSKSNKFDGTYDNNSWRVK